MKPLLIVPLTNEDEGIWADVIDRTARDTALGLGLSNMFVTSEDADRRDAELMLRIERRLTTVRWNPANYSPADRVVVCVCIDPVFWPPEGPWELDITYCA